MREKEKKCLEKLFRLIHENPNLPVIPEVGADVVCDNDYERWIGSWGDCQILDYIVGSESIHSRSNNKYDNDYENILTDCIEAGIINNDMDFDEMSEKDLKEAYESLPWKKAIFVFIDLP